MKKIILAVTAVAGFSLGAAAQQYFSLGPVVGFKHASVTNGSLANHFNVQGQTNPSFHAGIGLIYAKHEHWGFGGELLFSREGYRKEFVTANRNLNYEERNTVNYLRLPLRAYYFFGDYKSRVRPKLYAGPSVGFRLSEDRKVTEAPGSARVHGILGSYQPIDLGLQVGTGVNIALAKGTWLNLDLNYYQGLSDALRDESALSTGANFNQSLGLQVGVLFGLK